ncbi:MAG: membrane protein insertase YidC [Candidatus Dadabacteria bacterium]|nr:membrane protein insertase YidC [Candidatus Dadabacteria bacterium]NIS09367.1 membrane protein insertase YidC [Candidatus Dadabacteria bacterium]NIV42377.1 membrane protein insertase YidC [Candidatus Dadabacteria bacterium]NIX15903.1 membrane protein insertase YidC [Candidatus Dadabacteria bacterium]NIY22610.1 membrane protein insertase YidC [Candidatus Dadabacteria bacterium]
MNNDNKLNYILFFILSFAIILGYSLLFPPPKPKPTETENSRQDEVVTEQTVSQTDDSQIKDIQKPPVKSDNIFERLSDEADPYDTSEQLISVKSSLFEGKIDPLGARIVEWKLDKYNENTESGSAKYNLINDSPPSFNLGLRTNNEDIPNPIPFSYAGSKDIVLKDDAKELEFSWSSPGGITISKTYDISPDSYLITSTIKIANNTGKTIKHIVSVDTYSSTLKIDSQGRSKEFIALVSDEVEKESSNPEQTIEYTGKIGWFGFLDKYFLYTFLPESGDTNKVKFSSPSGEEELVRAVYSYPRYELKSGNEKPYKSKLYLGPLQVDSLKQAGSELNRAMDFGWFDWLAKPVLSLLNYMNKYFNNYGVSIIAITILIRVIFLPLTIKSMASMKQVQTKMQTLKPKIDALKEKYKDDKQKQNQEMMNLYTAHGVNPLSSLGGCLPMLVQIPVFIALYEVLLNSIDLRHSAFLWINDLSEAEVLFDIPGIGIPFRILPLAMGVSWFISQKMTPMTTPGSEQMELQMKMMQFMPIIFTVMFWGLPSGLVLYWTVSNLLSIVQQLYVNRKAATH